jgi:uncharacterized protein with HEPN domain
MTDRRPKLLFDAISAIDAARSFATGKSIDEYEADLLLRSAVERQLEILGEACIRLAKEDPTLFERAPEARLAVGLRNRIIHGYDAVDNLTVYRTVADNLPAFKATLSDWLSALRPAV